MINLYFVLSPLIAWGKMNELYCKVRYVSAVLVIVLFTYQMLSAAITGHLNR